MKGIETGKDKVQQICDVLKREAIEPAKREAGEIVAGAELQAAQMIQEAKKVCEEMLEEARQEIKRQKNVFQSSINQACKQALESLKQNIEEKLFNQELYGLIVKQTQDPRVLSQLVEAVVKAISKEGMEANLSIYVPAAVPARSVNALLAHDILAKLKEKSVLVSSIAGGIEVKLHKENLTIDISAAALKELVAGYIRKDFREILFAHE
jgi:V/A-type H+-transporting ATPase subunit E